MLGIDFGESRIGIAVSDPFGWIASAYCTINWQKSNIIPYDEIIKIVKKENITKIVIGFPNNMDGTVGFRGDRTVLFIEGLQEQLEKEELKIELIKWDERLTTKIAQNTINQMGIKRKNKKKIIDSVASSYILQNYLDYVGNGN